MAQAEIPTAFLIAGGTKGIGLGIARRLARPGVTLLLGYGADEVAAQTAAEQVRAAGATVYLLCHDIGSPEGAARMIDEASTLVSSLDGLIHSAAVSNPGPLLEQDIGSIREAIEIGGMALLYMVRPALKLLKEGSSVIFLSGIAVDIVLPQHGALAVAKAAGECIVRYLAIECGARRINFNTLRSGPVDTALHRSVNESGKGPPVTPLGRTLKVEDLAEAAAFLLSPAASMVRGQVIMVDGGLATTVRRP